MSIREMNHPQFEIEDHDEGLLVRLYVPGSKFGSVEVVLDLDEAGEMAESLEQAIAFSSLAAPASPASPETPKESA